MTKELAEKLLLLVNDPVIYNVLQEYVKYRINFVNRLIIHEPSLDLLRKHQGSLLELDNLNSLKDKVRSHVR